MPGLSLPILALIASAILFAPLASWLALQRARSWALWFLFGVALGPVASLLLVLGPPGRCPACGTTSVGWPRSCTNCGLVFASPAQAAGTAVSDRIGEAGAEAPAQPSGARPSRRPRVSQSGSAPTSAASATGEMKPGHRSATALGRRAPLEEPGPAAPDPATATLPKAAGPTAAFTSGPADASATRRAPTGTLVMLGSGVFIGGTERLQVGSRYLLGRVGAELQVLGPVHVSPAAVAARIHLAGVETTLLTDRLLISSGGPGRGTDLAFGGVSLESGVDVARDLRAPARKGRSAGA